MSKTRGRQYFTEVTLVWVVPFLIRRCFFTNSNTVFLLGLTQLHSEQIYFNIFFPKSLQVSCVSRFIDHNCAINNNAEFFSYFEKYTLKNFNKKWHIYGKHAPFFDLDINIEGGIFAHNFFDKKDKFQIFVVCMTRLSSNIPSWIFYGTVISEFPRIVWCTLRLNNFIPHAYELYLRMVLQGGDRDKIRQQIKRVFQKIANKTRAHILKLLNWLRTKKIYQIYESS